MNPTQSIALVHGTRPEQIKLSVLITLLGDRARVIHTGQHYDQPLTHSTTRPHLQLSQGGHPRGVQIGATTADLTRHFEHNPPRTVIVQGDTNAALAGALAANATGIPLIHIEAGLRSGDRAMPEEHNRILIDHLADYCCAATPDNVTNLWAEGIPADRILLTGNTIVEAVRLAPRDHRAAAAAAGPLADRPFILATVHRPENTDTADRLTALLTALAHLHLPVLLPLHPRTRARIDEFGLQRLLTPLTVTSPTTYPAFLALAERAAFLISDSGGIQEEAAVLGIRLIVLRRSTERPEALSDHCVLAHDLARLPRLATTLTHGSQPGTSIFGDGRASARIADLAHFITGPGPRRGSCRSVGLAAPSCLVSRAGSG
ncbi:non-hydrolyzing UDP-N-acetylglucosamine 2-epimerase [Streptomyces sp. NPDC002671]